MPRFLTALLIFISLLGLSCSSGEREEAPSAATLYPSGPFLPGGRATPTPQPAVVNVVTEWRKLDAPPLEFASPFGSQIVLDIQTGEMFSLTASPLNAAPYDPTRHYAQIQEWTAKGILLAVGHDLEGGTLYRTSPGQPFRAIYEYKGRGDWRAGPGNLLLGSMVRENPAASYVVVVDEATGKEVQRFDDAVVDSQSADRQVLALRRDFQTTTGRIEWLGYENGVYQTLLAQPQIGRTESVVWSSAGRRFAYNGYALVREGESELQGLRVFDMSTGRDLLVSEQGGIASWSPDDRYLAVQEGGFSDHRFQIFDLHFEKPVLTVTSAWFGGWLDGDTFLFSADVCRFAAGFRLTTMEVDGSNQRPLPDDNELFSGFPSPDGQRVAYQGDDGSIVFHDVRSEASIRFQTGMYRLPVLPRPELTTWSPDARYMVLMSFGGKDGWCGHGETSPPPTTIQVH